MENINDVCVLIDKCKDLFNSISNEKLLKIDLDDYRKKYNAMWNSRSAYIDAFAYLLIKLLKLTNKNEVFPVIRKIVLDNNVVNYGLIDNILEVYDGKVN